MTMRDDPKMFSVGKLENGLIKYIRTNYYIQCNFFLQIYVKDSA